MFTKHAGATGKTQDKLGTEGMNSERHGDATYETRDATPHSVGDRARAWGWPLREEDTYRQV